MQVSQRTHSSTKVSSQKPALEFSGHEDFVQQWATDGHKAVIRPSELTRKTSVTTHVQNSRISP